MNVMFPATTRVALAPAIIAAARHLLDHLERGERVETAILRAAMEAAFDASDTSGAWDWKAAYDTCEAASVLFLRKYGKALFRKAATPAARLAALSKIIGLLPTHTRRSEESQAMQQFSTPAPLGLAAMTAAAITPTDIVLEPSAGTGLLAILAEISGGTLLLNELADTRADLLASLFPAIAVTRFDAAQIDDHLAPGVIPSVVLMNPPFSALANVSGRVADAAYRHIGSALARLAEGGRLVAITGANFRPDIPAWHDAFARLQEHGTVVFTSVIDGSVYARHGTTFPTRLTVIDKRPAADPAVFPASAGIASDVATLLGWIEAQVPARLTVVQPAAVAPAERQAPRTVRGYLARAAAARPARLASIEPEGVELAYETVDWTPPEGARLTDAIYEEYALQSIRIPGARAHPTKLVQSAAMASVAPPRPSYHPMMPANIVINGLLSDAQLETVVYAGEAHGDHLAGSWTVDETFDLVSATSEDADGAVRFRRGFMLGDGTGAGKGRQAAGILLDNWLRGRRKAVWISKSDKLIEDAQRDWSALGMERLLVTPLSRFAQGRPITLTEGILFLTYATLRSDDRGEKVSRVCQIVEWLGSDFDGVIIFDESHAMQNAGGGKGERGDGAPSQQGRASLRLQHALPDARIVYVSATGATTVHNLAYAQRLGLWGGEDFPFASRAEFVTAIEDGGVAAMEVLARDLRSLGLYAARSRSYDDGEIERRVRLIRPMDHHHAPLKMMADSHWREADRDTFASMWNHEVAQVPTFSDSTLHIVAGLLLPVWRRLADESTRVYRLQTDDGERIVGRRVSAAWAANASETGFTVLLQSNDLKAALRPYCVGGPYGRLLDAEGEQLGEASVQAFETEGLLGGGAAPAVLAYLFHCIDHRLDGRPTLLIIDEGWLALDDEGFASQFREWLKTLRKKNASVVFATQSLSDIEGSPIAPAIIESCQTRILLPNERAIEPQITRIYQQFGLNDRQIEIIARAMPKRDYYCQSRRGNRLFELGLSDVALALCATSSKTDQAEIARILDEHGRNGFLGQWLRHRQADWAADLIPDLANLEIAS
jgi:hypothetical protein